MKCRILVPVTLMVVCLPFSAALSKPDCQQEGAIGAVKWKAEDVVFSTTIPIEYFDFKTTEHEASVSWNLAAFEASGAQGQDATKFDRAELYVDGDLIATLTSDESVIDSKPVLAKFGAGDAAKIEIRVANGTTISEDISLESWRKAFLVARTKAAEFEALEKSGKCESTTPDDFGVDDW